MSNGMELQVFDVKQQRQFLTNQTERLDKWCTVGEVRADALVRYALAEMEVDDNLRSCTPTSIYLALLACAVTGLVPGKLRGFAFLVPFTNTYGDTKRKEATFMIGWRGVKHQGFRVGVDMLSAVIHRNDVFDYDVGTMGFVKYRAAFEGRGPVIGTAAWAKLPRNGLEVEYLDLETLQKIENQANRIRQSPAWNGPFKDQMQRKSALRRLGKQVELGEDFFKGQALDDDEKAGSMAATLDRFTDGEATRLLSQQSTEAAAFAGIPRPAQSQVPATLPEGRAAQSQQKSADASAGSGKKSDAKAKPIDAQATERPTTPAASSGSTPTFSASTSPAAGGSEPMKATGSSSAIATSTANPTTPPATTSTTGSASPPASAATPAASSPPASNSTQSASPSSAVASSSESSADVGFGDVASEPSADEAFDTSFGDDETNDPVDRQPQTRADWMAAFQTWAAAHPTREDVLGDDSWVVIFRGWANSCRTQKEMDEDKPVFQEWSKKAKLTFGRKADPAKGIAAIAPDKQITQMQDEFAKRYRLVVP